MTIGKSLSAISVVAVCLAWSAGDAAGQARGRPSGGGGGQHAAAAPRGPAPATAGHAVPRPPYNGHYPVYGRPGYGYPRYGYPYYGYGYPYYGYYGYPGFSVGFGIGFGYGYGSYGYPYYAYPYGGYPYAGYTYAAPGYVTSGGPGPAYGGVRIQGAPHDAQVYADGYFVGTVDDFDGSTQQLSLQSGVHKIEIRVGGQPPVEFDVNIQPGQTITYRAGMTR
jgi:hypothetical protein